MKSIILLPMLVLICVAFKPDEATMKAIDERNQRMKLFRYSRQLFETCLKNNKLSYKVKKQLCFAGSSLKYEMREILKEYMYLFKYNKMDKQGIMNEVSQYVCDKFNDEECEKIGNRDLCLGTVSLCANRYLQEIEKNVVPDKFLTKLRKSLKKSVSLKSSKSIKSESSEDLSRLNSDGSFYTTPGDGLSRAGSSGTSLSSTPVDGLSATSSDASFITTPGDGLSRAGSGVEPVLDRSNSINSVATQGYDSDDVEATGHAGEHLKRFESSAL